MYVCMYSGKCWNEHVWVISASSAMKSSLFSYAIEEKKLYILMFCAFLHHIRKSNNSCVQVSWASPCPETKLTVQPCWSKNIFACFCRVQPDVALEMLILMVSRQMANALSENYRKLAKLLRSLEVIQVLVPFCCWTHCRKIVFSWSGIRKAKSHQ